MNDIRAPSGISFDAGVSAPVSGVPDTGEAAEKDQLAFNDALAKGGELNESQSPETRNAVKRSLDRIQTSPETARASGSGASETDGAHHGRPTQLADRRPAGAVDRDGADSARRSRRAADSGGEDPVTAQVRSPRTSPASPSVSHGGARDSTACSRSPADPGPASADRKQAGAAAEGNFAPEQAQARSALEAAFARAAPTPGMQGAPPRAPGGRFTSRTQGAVSEPRTDDAHDADIATVGRSNAAASAASVESGHSRVAELADSEPDTDDAHDADIAALDMSGVAASPATVESGQTRAAEGVQAPVSRVAELAEQVADRILVSAPESDAPGEVRISLKQSILDGSDVRMFHEGGELKVVFVAETESARHLLVNIREQFQHTLGERLQGQRVHVEVEAPERGGTSGDDNRRRSRQQYVRQDDDSSVAG